MKTLVIRSSDNVFYVKYRVSMLTETDFQVTVNDVELLNTDDEFAKGLQTKFKKGLTYKLKDFKDFCNTYTKILEVITNETNTKTQIFP
jgi:hypothetical protein